MTLFGIYAVFRFRKEYATAQALYDNDRRRNRAILQRDEFTMAETFTMLPRVLPFVLLLTGVMIALYGGYATPSETAGLGGDAGAGADRGDLQRVAAERPVADPRNAPSGNRPC